MIGFRIANFELRIWGGSRMDELQLEKRTKTFAIWVIRYVARTPGNSVMTVLGHQLLRSATSIGANYREANRAESRKDFAHKIGIVEKEAAETQYWLELCDEATIGSVQERRFLYRECTELLAIFTRVGRTLKQRPNSKFEIRNSKSPS
ncbi:MAG: four helix bundle protein [Acidobacteria bacterium]|nr:MAG: four helix bundle protein [Acidobacteriota bacterium]